MVAGQSPRSGGPGSSRTALTNAGVFDGRRLQAPGAVVIDGGLISTGPTGTGLALRVWSTGAGASCCRD